MARVSSAPEDAYKFKGSFEEGWGVIVGASAVNFQYPPTKEAKGNRPAGSQDPPQLMAQLEIQRYMDGEGNKAPTPPDEVLLTIQKPDKMTGELSACHPGNYPDGNLEADPEDAGGELGASGDTLFAMQDGYQINDKVKWMRFAASLQAKGFKPQILKRTYFPDLIGTYAYFKNEPVKGGSAEFDGNAFVVDKIVKFPYEKDSAGAAKGKTASSGTKPVAGKGKPNGTPPPETESPAAAAAVDNSDSSIEEIAQSLVTDTLAPSKTGTTLKDGKKLRIEALMAIKKHKPAIDNSLVKKLQDQLSEDWLIEFGSAVGVLEKGDDGQITFA